MRKRHLYFDQYASERLLLGRWLEGTAMRCELSPKGAFAASNGSAESEAHVPCAADILVVTTPFTECALTTIGFSVFDMLTAGLDMMGTHMQLLRAALTAGAQPVGMVLLHAPFVGILIRRWAREIAGLPAPLAKRVIVTSPEPLQRQINALRNPFRHVRLPFSHELELRTAAGARRGTDHNLWIAMPYPVSILGAPKWTLPAGAYSPPAHGRPILLFMFTSSNWHRQRTPLQVALKRLNGTCDNTGSCVLCRPGREAECALPESTQPWSAATRATFCLQPGGDTPTRSHFYLAALSGCVPVVFDTGLPFWPEHPAPYAWRPSGLPPVASVGDASRGVGVGAEPWWRTLGLERNPLLNYTRFSLSVPWDDFHAISANQTMLEGNLTELLRTIAATPGAEVRALAAGLDEAIPYLRTSATDCGSTDCDAFSRLRSVVSAAWRFQHRKAERSQAGLVN